MQKSERLERTYNKKIRLEKQVKTGLTSRYKNHACLIFCLKKRVCMFPSQTFSVEKKLDPLTAILQYD